MWQLYRILKLVDKNDDRTDVLDLIRNIKTRQRFSELFKDGFIEETEEQSYALTSKGRQKLDELRQHRAMLITGIITIFISLTFGVVNLIAVLSK